MNEPSDGVPPGLVCHLTHPMTASRSMFRVGHRQLSITDLISLQLPHAHLVSNFRFPYATHLTVDTIVDYLLQAPSITRHTSPMNWTFLDAPPDGTLLLVWQPTQLGINSASDGYIWADAEHAFSLNAKGCVSQTLSRSLYID